MSEYPEPYHSIPIEQWEKASVLFHELYFKNNRKTIFLTKIEAKALGIDAMRPLTISAYGLTPPLRSFILQPDEVLYSVNHSARDG